MEDKEIKKLDIDTELINIHRDVDGIFLATNEEQLQGWKNLMAKHLTNLEDKVKSFRIEESK